MVYTAHHIKALPSALEFMAGLGFSAARCLAGTGVDEADLVNPGHEPAFSLEQELRFYRNLLALTGDPLLGLRMGNLYSLESYGLLGYAFMSAPTLRHGMTILRNYGPLSFTLFRLDFVVEGPRAILRFSPGIEVPQDLLPFYVDRDLTAALFGGKSALREPLAPLAITLPHGGLDQRPQYVQHFDCPVTFDAPAAELHIDAAVLDEPLPLRDADTSSLCQRQCHLLLTRMSASSGCVEKVRQLIVARPGYFPDIEYVAEKLGMTGRTLRRRLAAENSSYQQVLGDVRYRLAQEYLGTSNLPLEEIAVLLGYSAPGNFTNAFKRWHGSSPRQFRQETQ